MSHLTIIMFTLGLAIGILTIYITYFEEKKYKTALVRYLLYFMIVTNLATAINLFYNYFLINLIKNLGFGFARTIELSYRLFASILLVFVFGVFISLFRNLNNEIFSKKYKLTLIFIWFILIIIFFINLDSFFIKKKGIPIPVIINIIIDYLGMLIVTYEIIRTIFKSKNNLDLIKKNIILKFSYGCLFVFLIIISMIPLSIFTNISNDIQTFISSLIFLLMFNLIPLLFIKKVLRLYYYDLSLEKNSSENFNKFLESKKISETETKIINLICDGLTNKEIADKLFLSTQTIKDHNYRIFKKLEVTNRVQLTKLF